MKLRYYVARRLLFMIFVLLGISFITFVILYLTPGDPTIRVLGERATQEQVDALRHEWGLDRPVYEQYFMFLQRLLRGDLGLSLHTLRPVSTEVAQYLPATFELSSAAIVVAVALGIPIGVMSAVKRNKLPDHVARLFALLGVSMPVFWIGLLMLLLFYYFLGWTGPGRIDPTIIPPIRITGLFTIDSMLTGNIPALISSLHHLILPAFVLGFFNMAVIARMTRSSMLEVLSQDFIRAAKAKGCTEYQVIYKHALRNALIPTVTVIGLTYGNLLAGAVVTETIFYWPGLGTYVVDSAASLDFNAVIGVALVIVVMYTIVNLIVDLLYAFLDPRIRY
jgi:peptide/nickel transport system permease protein